MKTGKGDIITAPAIHTNPYPDGRIYSDLFSPLWRRTIVETKPKPPVTFDCKAAFNIDPEPLSNAELLAVMNKTSECLNSKTYPDGRMTDIFDAAYITEEMGKRLAQFVKDKGLMDEFMGYQ